MGKEEEDYQFYQYHLCESMKPSDASTLQEEVGDDGPFKSDFPRLCILVE